MRIAVKHRTRIYYLRWYYEGWHYWAFRGAAETLTTTALDLKYTIQLGDDQLTKRQLNAISGLLGSKYIHLLTDDGWKQCTMNPTTFGFGSSNNIGANVTFALNVWAKVGAFTPLVLPDILPPPMLYISKYAMSFTAKQGMPSDVQTYTIKGENIISNVQINAPAGWEISSDNAAWVTGITISPIGGVVSERTIYVRMNSATVGENNAFIANTTTGVNKNIVVNGVVSEVTIKYGLLYNWYATQIQSGGQSIVNPAESANGWKVPTQSDRELLYNNAGYVLDVMNPQIKLKEAGIIYWNIGNNGENTLKLNIKGGGSREASGFVGIKNYHEIFLQTETASNIPYAMLFKLNGGTSSVSSSVKNRGAGIRLCNPTTVLTDGQVGTYTGNDGSVYRTICIESQEWLADNLVETKWSDGTYIDGFDSNGYYVAISKVDWEAKTTGAVCAYDDDLNNVWE